MEGFTKKKPFLRLVVSLGQPWDPERRRKGRVSSALIQIQLAFMLAHALGLVKPSRH